MDLQPTSFKQISNMVPWPQRRPCRPAAPGPQPCQAALAAFVAPARAQARLPPPAQAGNKGPRAPPYPSLNSFLAEGRQRPTPSPAASLALARVRVSRWKCKFLLSYQDQPRLYSGATVIKSKVSI